MPLEWAYWPVSRRAAARAGRAAQKALRKMTPSSARRWMFGVLTA